MPSLRMTVVNIKRGGGQDVSTKICVRDIVNRHKEGAPKQGKILCSVQSAGDPPWCFLVVTTQIQSLTPSNSSISQLTEFMFSFWAHISELSVTSQTKKTAKNVELTWAFPMYCASKPILLVPI